MKENTNKAIALNSIILYLRMVITAILGLFTTRWSLQALGVNDFGLFSVVGSIMTFISIFNTIMLSTCNRFLAVAIGKGNLIEINKVFNVNRIIFAGCAIFLLLVAFPIGYYYVENHIHYDGPIENAILVFVLSIVGSVISTFSIPYNGLLIAKERFVLFSVVDVVLHTIRLLVVFLLVYHFTHKLLVYSILQAATIATPTLIYSFYCRRNFRSITKWHLVKEKQYYRNIFSFSGWVAIGAVVTVARQQGAAFLVNAFFSTIMNTALGIANSINMYITLFANNLTQPIQPQITKSYAVNNIERTSSLLIFSTKYSFMLMLLISTPFLINSEWIIELWLGRVPDYAAAFTFLLVIDNLVQSFNSGLSTVIFASGKIALYQILVNVLRLLSIVGAYFVLKSGAQPQNLFVSYIVFSILVVFATQYCLHRELKFDVKKIVSHSYLPCATILICFLPVLLIRSNMHPLLVMSASIIYLIIIEYFIGTNKNEKKKIYQGLIKIKTKLNLKK